MTKGAHLIVNARVIDVRPGRVFGEGEGGAYRSTHLVLEVLTTYKGRSSVGDRVTLGMGLADLDVDVAARYAAMVDDHGMFFLIPTWAPQPEFGIGDYPPDRRFEIYRPVNSQGVFIRDGDRVALGLYQEDDGFPSQLTGIAFEDLKRRVEAAVETAEAS